MIEFKKYEGSTTLENLGTLESIIGSKGGVKFNNKNFNNTTKRVVVIASNGSDESAIVTCSSTVSNILRKAKADGVSDDQLKAWVITLEVLENEQGGYYITMPASGEVQPFTTVASLKKVKVTAKMVDYAELAAL